MTICWPRPPTVPAGSEGLLFLPYLTGERTPHPDPLARGAFVGLTVRHSHAAPDPGRAGRGGLRPARQPGADPEAGIGADRAGPRFRRGHQSPLWRQILADVLDTELVTVNTTEGAAFGAALLAGVGAGVWSSVGEACDSTIRVLSSTQPLQEQVSYYNQAYPEYRQLYPRLTDTLRQRQRCGLVEQVEPQARGDDPRTFESAWSETAPFSAMTNNSHPTGRTARPSFRPMPFRSAFLPGQSAITGMDGSPGRSPRGRI